MTLHGTHCPTGVHASSGRSSERYRWGGRRALGCSSAVAAVMEEDMGEERTVYGRNEYSVWRGCRGGLYRVRNMGSPLGVMVSGRIQREYTHVFRGQQSGGVALRASKKTIRVRRNPLGVADQAVWGVRPASSRQF